MAQDTVVDRLAGQLEAAMDFKLPRNICEVIIMHAQQASTLRGAARVLGRKHVVLGLAFQLLTEVADATTAHTIAVLGELADVPESVLHSAITEAVRSVKEHDAHTAQMIKEQVYG